MNNTNEGLFQVCDVFDFKYEVLNKVQSKNVFYSMVSCCVFVTSLIVPTTFLNGVSAVTVLKSPQLKEKIVYFLIMVQSLVDLVGGFVALPLYSYVCITQTIGNAYCFIQRIIFIILYIPFSASLTILAVMTFDRYLSILHPLKHKATMTKGKLKTFFVSAFLFITAFAAISLLNTKLHVGFHVITMFLFIFFAIFAYTRIYIAIRTRKLPGDVVVAKSKNQHKILKEIKLVKSCFLPVVCFLLCFFAASIILLFENQLEKEQFVAFKMWTGTLNMLYSSLNSIIFFWTRPLLRKEAYKVMKKMATSRT